MAQLELLPEYIFDTGIVIRNTTLQDIDDIVRIWSTLGDEPEEICGRIITEEDLYAYVTRGYSPDMLGAIPERYRMKTIEDDSGHVIGYLELYHGYPDSETLWVKTLIVERACWGAGYSHVVLGTLHDFALDAGYTALGTSLPVMNWPRVRFFLREGFNQVLGLTGDEVYEPGNMAMLCLGKYLGQNL